MKDKTLDDYVSSLDEKEFEKQFLIELDKCISDAYIADELKNAEDMLTINSYMSNKYIKGFSDNNVIHLGSMVQVKDDLFDGDLFCWNKIYVQNKSLIVESSDFDLCFEVMDAIKQAELKYKIKFVEIDAYGDKTGFIEEIK